jgi:hypothetical protein
MEGVVLEYCSAWKELTQLALRGTPIGLEEGK